MLDGRNGDEDAGVTLAREGSRPGGTRRPLRWQGMHFWNLCADLGIPREAIASTLGIEQRLVEAIDAGEAEVANRSSVDRSLENAVQRLRAKAGKPVDEFGEQDVLRAIQRDRFDNRDAPLPAELAMWECDANAELDASIDNAREYLAKHDVPVGGTARDDVRIHIIDGLRLKGAIINSGTWWIGRIRLIGYAVKVPPPVRS